MTTTLAPTLDYSGFTASNAKTNWMDSLTLKKSSTHSATSKRLDAIEISLVGSYSVTSTTQLESFQQQLSSIFFECSTANWDGYDALPISKGAYIHARLFVNALPDSYPKPTPVPENDGEIALEWDMDGKTLSLSFGDMPTISYAMHASSEHKTYGVHPYEKGTFSRSLQAIFQQYISA